MSESVGNASEIPEMLKNHCMIGKYEYERVDKETGKYKLFFYFYTWISQWYVLPLTIPRVYNVDTCYVRMGDDITFKISLCHHFLC